jgi:phosphatidylglycerophosphate synthase
MYFDDSLANTLVANTPIFAYIHPNVFSCASIILNFVILYLLKSGRGLVPQYILLAAIFAARYLTDILDGAIARTYSKVSVVGGILDTVGDALLILIICWYICAVFGLPSIYVAYAAVAMATFMIYEGTVHDHAAYKVYGRDRLRDIVAWGINNTVWLFAATYLFIVVTLPRCSVIAGQFEGCELRT